VMNDDFEELTELEDVSDLVEVEELQANNGPSINSDFPELKSKFIKNLPHLKLMTNLEFSRIPAVIMDSKLNILWENSSYADLFIQGERDFPINLVSDFSPFLTPDRLGSIYKNITDKNSGYSYRGKLESKHRNRLSIIANLIITPYFTKKIITSDISTPPIYVGLFDDISKENKELLEGTFLTLLEASKLKDNDTGNHIKRVGEYSKSIATKLFDNPAYPEVNTEFIENIFFLAPMHDVGKIGTPDDILTKPGALNEAEWKIMKEHTINGAYILKAYPDPMAAQIATFHHEKWNGNGYPYGVSGSDIPLPARVVSIADVYDALRMKRSYKEAFSHSEAMEIITKDAGFHFDPDLVKIFINFNSEFEDIYERLRDS